MNLSRGAEKAYTGKVSAYSGRNCLSVVAFLPGAASVKSSSAKCGRSVEFDCCHSVYHRLNVLCLSRRSLLQHCNNNLCQWDWRISTHANPSVHTPRDFTNGASLAWRLHRRISMVMFTRGWACPARWPFRPILGFWGAKFPEMGDSLLWTPTNRHAKCDAARFILGEEIRNRTNTQKQ